MKIDELVRRYDAYDGQRRAEKNKELARVLPERRARAEELLANELIGPYALVVERNDDGGTVFEVWPEMWNNLLHFRLVVYQTGSCRVQNPEGMGIAMGASGGLLALGSAADWAQTPLADFLVAWHRHYPKSAEQVIQTASNRLEEGKLLETEAQGLHGTLVSLAPERREEWDRQLADWVAREASLSASLMEHREAHAVAFERYLAAAVTYQIECRAAEARNREVWDELKNRFSRPCSVRCIEYVITTFDGDGGGRVEARTVLTNDTEGDVHKDQWPVLENGRRKTWTFRNITRISASYLVEPEADKYCGAFLHRYSQFGSFSFLEKDEREVDAILRTMVWPARPDPEDYGLSFMTAEETARLEEVLCRNN